MTDVTAIIPTYNSANCLTDSIESVLNQTYKSLTLIVVDDGSTDDTQRVLKPYIHQIRYISQHNGGPSKARNTGILAADSKYIALLDADDIWLPEKIELQLNLIESDYRLGIVFSDLELIDEEGNSQGSFWKSCGCYEDMIREPQEIGKGFAKLMKKNFILPSSALIKKECFNKVGLFDESITVPAAEDKDLWLRISMRYGLACVPHPLVKRRTHIYSPKRVAEVYESVIYVIKKMERSYPDHIEKENVNVRKILGWRYYILGRTYLDQDDIRNCRKAFMLSMWNHCSVRAFIFWVISVMGIRVITCVRAFKKFCSQSVLVWKRRGA